MVTAPETDTVKVGYGIEMPLEALLELLEQRFPNLVDWNALAGAPFVEYDGATQVFGLYWAGYVGEDSQFNEEVVRTPLRVGVGAPIPVTRITNDNLSIKGHPRCGIFPYIGSDIGLQPRAEVDRKRRIWLSYPHQCIRALGHDGEHMVE